MTTCKHCHLEIMPQGDYWVHAEGVHLHKARCAVNPYGFLAEPVGTPCGANPINPCNGALGMTVYE